jgi:hypothetical protein
MLKDEKKRNELKHNKKKSRVKKEGRSFIVYQYSKRKAGVEPAFLSVI